MTNQITDTTQVIQQGALIRVKESQLKCWTADTATKMANRIGEVTRVDANSGAVFVRFPKIGRRLEFKLKFLRPDGSLQRVTDPQEIKQWQQDVLASAQRKESRTSTLLDANVNRLMRILAEA